MWHWVSPGMVKGSRDLIRLKVRWVSCSGVRCLQGEKNLNIKKNMSCHIRGGGLTVLIKLDRGTTKHPENKTHLIAPGLENRLLCGCCVGTAVGTGMGAGAEAGAGSRVDSFCAMSTTPPPASDPKSKAPN